MKIDNIDKPEAEILDVAHTGCKAGLALIPVVGGAVAEVFAAVITPPIEKRRDEWMKSIVDKLRELENKIEDFNIDELPQNELFISALIQASKVVISTHQKEKINSLRNIILNTACSNNTVDSNKVDDDKQLTFIRFIDDFTEQHIKILKFLNNPENVTKFKLITEMGKIKQVIFDRTGGVTYYDYQPEASNTFIDCRIININDYPSEFDGIFPERKNNELFYNQILKDLNNKDLIIPQSINAIHLVKDDSRLFDNVSGTTHLGKQLIKFITSPIDNN